MSEEVVQKSAGLRVYSHKEYEAGMMIAELSGRHHALSDVERHLLGTELMPIEHHTTGVIERALREAKAAERLKVAAAYRRCLKALETCDRTDERSIALVMMNITKWAAEAEREFSAKPTQPASTNTGEAMSQSPEPLVGDDR